MENKNANCKQSADAPMNVSTQVCHGCQQNIDDDYRLYVAPDLHWHVACLLCSECHSPMTERDTCIIRDGRPYCRTDYIQLFGCVCALCHCNIGASDLIMRAKSQVFHLECFQCSACEHQLQPGEQYAVSSGKLFCHKHFDSLPLDPPSTCTPPESSNANSRCPGPDAVSTGPRKRGSVADKGPRVRTVLSEQQLQTLRTVYASNPRPDALLKEHLVELTGLNPRVIRVWFQNKRCKDKKRVIQAEAIARQQQQGQTAKQPLAQGQVQIPPLTPQAPPTPDSLGQISPQSAAAMAVFQYPPASYEAGSRPAVSPIAYHQNMSAWGSPPENLGPFEAEFSSPMTTEAHNTVYTSVTSQPNAFSF
jgi:insulin gene enhancer protein ISL-1